MVDLTVNYGGISPRFNLKPSYAIVVNIVCFKVAQPVVESENTHVSAMMNKIASHNWVGKILYLLGTQNKI